MSEGSLDFVIPESPTKPRFQQSVMVMPETTTKNESLLAFECDLKRTVLENHKRRQQQQAKSKKGRKPKKVRKWTKPKDAPKRPLSAYNLFVRDEREAMLRGEFNSGTGVGRVAKQVAARWRLLDETKKEAYEKLARVEKKLYFEAVKEWKQKKQEQEEQEAQESFSIRMREYYQSSFGAMPITPTSSGKTAPTTAPCYPIMCAGESYEPPQSPTGRYGWNPQNSPNSNTWQNSNTTGNVQMPYTNANAHTLPYNFLVNLEPKKVDKYQPLPYDTISESIKKQCNTTTDQQGLSQPKQVVIDLEPVEDPNELSSETIDDETVNFMSRLADGNFL